MALETNSVEFTLNNNEIITDNDIKTFIMDGKETEITPKIAMQVKKMFGYEPKIQIILNNGRIVNKSEITNVEVIWNQK